MNVSVVNPTSKWRVARWAGLYALCLICASCGDTFRPIATPIVPPPPDPSSFHYVLSVSQNGPGNPGSSTKIDVSGDTNVGVAKMGLGPVHATIIPSGVRIYIANNLEDTVSFYGPTDSTSVSTVSLQPGAKPVFVHTTTNDLLWVANSGDNTVSSISVVSNVVTKTIAVGAQPYALSETPDGKKLYVVNRGDNTVSSINTLDKTVVATIPTGSQPIWAVARSDSRRVYVLNQGSGTVTAIDTTTDAAAGPDVSVGAGASSLVYDAKLNRLYITNPLSNLVVVLDASGDLLSPRPSIDLSGGVGSLCAAACTPSSIAVLPDGGRAYAVVTAPSTDPISGAPAIASQVIVLDAQAGVVRTLIDLTLADIDEDNATGCDVARFRTYVAAAAGGTRVYISNCDAGHTSIVRTSDDTVVAGDQFVVQPTDPPTCAEINAPVSIAAPYSSFAANSLGCEIQGDKSFFWNVPPLQNPVFLVTGP